jgi:Lrp/AsnC family leucine-responsive transcriptional regulator
MAKRSPPTSRARDLDRIDREILKRLQADGRLTISQLAADVNLTVSPCSERVRRLEERGYIRGYFAQLNPERLGLDLLAYILVTLDRTTPETFERFDHAVQDLEEVLECQMVGGDFDYLLKIRVKNMHAYRKFLGERMTAIASVRMTHTYFVMEEVKSSHRLAVPA